MNPATGALPKDLALKSSAQIVITVQTGLREIWAHKFRSLLTMLGIILGVSSLVAMSALVAGMEKGAKEALIAIGGLEKVRIEPQEIPIEQRYLTDQAVGLTVHRDGCVGVRGFDEAEDLAILLVDPVLLVVDAEPALRVEVGLVCPGDRLGRHGSVQRVDVHEHWHCLFPSMSVPFDGCG